MANDGMTKDGEWRTQYGARIIWKDPVKAGVPDRDLPDYPASARWLDFESEEQRETFAERYRLDRDVERIEFGRRQIATTEWEFE